MTAATGVAPPPRPGSTLPSGGELLFCGHHTPRAPSLDCTTWAPCQAGRAVQRRTSARQVGDVDAPGDHRDERHRDRPRRPSESAHLAPQQQVRDTAHPGHRARVLIGRTRRATIPVRRCAQLSQYSGNNKSAPAHRTPSSSSPSTARITVGNTQRTNMQAPAPTGRSAAPDGRFRRHGLPEVGSIGGSGSSDCGISVAGRAFPEPRPGNRSGASGPISTVSVACLSQRSASRTWSSISCRSIAPESSKRVTKSVTAR